MPSIFSALIAAAVLCLSASGLRAEVALQKNNTVLFYGNSMIERLTEQGELESLIQLAQPEKALHFRSLAWTGDEVGYRLRPEGYEGHLKSLLKEWPAQLVIVGFGMNEAFNGAAGLTDFRAQRLSGTACTAASGDTTCPPGPHRRGSRRPRA